MTAQIDEVNERGTWISTIAFTDEDDVAVTPDSAIYKIEDVGSNTVVRTWTTIGSLSTSVDVEWTEDDTVILDSSRSYEQRKLTVFWTYDTDKHGTDYYLLNVVNLGGITATSPV